MHQSRVFNNMRLPRLHLRVPLSMLAKPNRLLPVLRRLLTQSIAQRTRLLNQQLRSSSRVLDVLEPGRFVYGFDVAVFVVVFTTQQHHRISIQSSSTYMYTGKGVMVGLTQAKHQGVY